MCIITKTAVLIVLALAPAARASDRAPGETWLMYATPEQAGFSSAQLAQAREYWESIPAAAAMIVHDGAVVAAWGDVQRRFMLHSARKSLMSALYGIQVDAGKIGLDKTLAQLGIDDVNPALSADEKQAKIVDLLRARSGVYHAAAAEPPQNAKPPRGSHAPGTYWCYNNWDFNVLGTILEREAQINIFEEFKLRFADPLQMQDYRVRDGMYQREPHKSIHAAYHFRMSARDMARLGLLYLNRGEWNGKRILSEDWISRSTRAHSENAWFSCGYGYLWWIYREAPFGELGMYSALGVGEQSIDVIPGANMVFVLRTDTFGENQVSGDQRLRLLRLILEARRSKAASKPQLIALPPVAEDWQPVPLEEETNRRLCGRARLPVPFNTECTITMDGNDLVLEAPLGTFGLIPLSRNRFMMEDLRELLYFELNPDGSVKEICTETSLVVAGYELLQAGDTKGAIRTLRRGVQYFPSAFNVYDSLGEAYMVSGDMTAAIRNYEKSLELNPDNTNAVKMLERCRNPQEILPRGDDPAESATGSGGATSGQKATANEAAKMPMTPVGRHAAAFFEAFNSGDENKMLSYAEMHLAQSALEKKTSEQRIEQYRQLRGMWNTLTPLRVVQSEERLLSLLIRADATGAGLAIRFHLEDEAPYGVLATPVRGPLPLDATDEDVLRALE